ncbi:MAG TPA: putative Ig domain-containing protein [Pyrinomonadaceae bacterium]|nr:putative Ig domain-containing protein [Pyrinomonadaceae bacterium]HMP64742.1 putative Ig domain-containing protein [Pyrinomonadaceae bacterium]
MKIELRMLVLTLLFALAVLQVSGAVYEVRPGTAMTTIAQVPWATLQPGDTVLIHWRAEPYKEKWVICRQGTAENPITVSGVPGPNGELPIIDGNGATTPSNLNFWSEQRGVIKIGGANVPADTMPRHIIIENLEIRGAHPDYQFTGRNGNLQSYASAASPIFVEKGEFITVRNNIITDGANGFFVASSDSAVSRNIVVEGNYIYGNGIVGSIFQHNNYTAAIGIVFQYNRFGPLRSGAPGVNLKDRSAGLVVRYNWIEGGNRNIDMVDGEDTAIIRNAPEYRKTFVYGNILIKQDGGNNQVAHYGGDSGNTANYRKGKLYFYNNTIYSIRAGNTTVLRLSTNDEQADLRNNIFFNTAAGTSLAMLAESGTLTLANNWAKTGWRNSHDGGFNGTITGGATMVTGTAPGFSNASLQEFGLTENAQARDAGTALHTDVLPDHNAVRQYVKHQTSMARPVSGQFDLGAFEYSAAVPMQILTTSLPVAFRSRHYNQALQAEGGSGSFVWSVSSGSLPAGLILDPQTGIIRGRPRANSPTAFTVTVADANDATATAVRDLTISVRLHN